MQIAMQMVRETMGDDAIIISTKKGEINGEVQITAACDDELQGNEVADDADYDEWFSHLSGGVSNEIVAETKVNSAIEGRNIPLKAAQKIEKILKSHGVNHFTRKYLLERLENLCEADCAHFNHYQSPLHQWFAALIANSFEISPIKLHGEAIRHIFVGAQGVGKTLTVAKIAAHLVQHNHPVHVISVDNKKAGATEQLAAITSILGLELLVAENRQALKSMLEKLPSNEAVLVDSAGANPYDFHELKELAEYANLGELEPVLVYAAGGDPMEADEIARAFSFMGAEKMIITKIDAARRFGSVLNAVASTQLKIANITATQKILGAFDAANAEIITKLFFAYQDIEFQNKEEIEDF